jgi:hypothetical protein
VPVVYNQIQIETATASSIGASTEIVISVADSVHNVEVLRLKMKHASGTATTFAPRLHSATGGTAGAMSQEFAVSSTAVADLCDVVASGVICLTDASGKLYLIPAPNAGAANSFQYTIAYRVLA